MALDFYSRMQFVVELLPLVNAAQAAGEDARVVSVLAAGQGAPIDLEDLGLKKTFSPTKSMNQTPTYTSVMFEVSFFFYNFRLSIF